MKEERGVKVYLRSFFTLQYMELSGQLPTLATIPLERTQVAVEWEARIPQSQYECFSNAVIFILHPSAFWHVFYF
jgi:hypothetical protein